MSQGEIKSNDPILLQQTIIYLRSELNKYKTKYNRTSSSLLDELIMENERLTNKYRDLLHQNKKYEKRIQLYEQRIRSLEFQRKESLSAMELLQCTEQDLRTANKQLCDVLASIGSDRQLETPKSIERLEMKINSLLPQNTPPKNEHSYAEGKLTKVQLELETSKNMNAKQQELIGILEEYVQKLTEEVHAYNELTAYLIQESNDLSPE
ncbi:hypothetical protein QTL97_17985 [Sporosarcina thermotolerans]|uniref:Uncharacterized protein n=1 Tax=Sporosarcina thermotolerans TaxID=633404 RepID=A0AAW9AHU2_9BACL|nr:hypothetical protein [Sporosarcina thermotolerans]MDW0118818.1 hypothetical protein [Sporosarcina thermotolerans]WHT48509.1 hypothetical protein QNH10_01310 [Sporosarcina thermotolerans]